MSQTERTPTTHHILSRVISGQPTEMPEQAAQYWAPFALPKSDQERVQELGEKNQADELTTDEKAELDQYAEVIELVDLLKAEALNQLRSHS